MVVPEKRGYQRPVERFSWGCLYLGYPSDGIFRNNLVAIAVLTGGDAYGKIGSSRVDVVLSGSKKLVRKLRKMSGHMCGSNTPTSGMS